MARGSAIDAGLTRRIRTSPHTITVEFRDTPPVVATPVVNPFPKQTLSALTPTPAPTPVATALTVACLWHDRPTDDSNPGALQAAPIAGGWYEEATALARVLVADIALDVNNPGAGTTLDNAVRVLFNGKAYELLNLTPVAAGFRVATSYALWLRGSQH
jgi:hypothetical protein